MTNSKTDNKSKYRVPALEKGFDILEALARTSTPMTLTQLANGLGRSTNEIFRVLNSLEQRGYVRRNETTAAYCLSLKLYELAHQHPPVQVLLSAAAQPMERLAETVGESCHLSVLRRGKMVILQQALSPMPVRLSSEVGGCFPAINTVSGRLLLAYMAPDERERFLADDDEYPAMSSEEQAVLADKLALIRDQGYAMAEHETHIGVRDYAVLVGNPAIGISASLAVAALTPIRTPTESVNIVRALEASAVEITEELGFQSRQSRKRNSNHP